MDSIFIKHFSDFNRFSDYQDYLVSLADLIVSPVYRSAYVDVVLSLADIEQLLLIQRVLYRKYRHDVFFVSALNRLSNFGVDVNLADKTIVFR